jgi:hypothetical protein
MKSSRLAALAIGFVVVACVVPRKSEAQSISQRVRSAPDGRVRFSFASKPGICGHNNSIQHGPTSRTNWSSGSSRDVEYDIECDAGPVRVVLDVQDGSVNKLRTYVGGRWRQTSSTTDLGTVSTRAATDYLLDLASKSEGKVAHEAILPATLADSVTVWPALVRIARDEDVQSGTRKQAMFWLSVAAGDRVDRDGSENSSPDAEVKKQAVFALSQQRRSESVATLMEVARRNRDPDVRRSALFWLGQTNDPRAVSVFEEILTR